VAAVAKRYNNYYPLIAFNIVRVMRCALVGYVWRVLFTTRIAYTIKHGLLQR